jgi:hypothetical protein
MKWDRGEMVGGEMVCGEMPPIPTHLITMSSVIIVSFMLSLRKTQIACLFSLERQPINNIERNTKVLDEDYSKLIKKR